MHRQTIPEESEEFAHLDRAILGLLLSDQRDWPDTKIAAKIGDDYGDVPASLDRLQRYGLIERSGNHARASRAAVHADQLLTL